MNEGVSESVIVAISTQSAYWDAARPSRFLKHTPSASDLEECCSWLVCKHTILPVI